MVDLKDLHPGMKIQIVDHWGPGCHQNPDGRMDHWLGQIVTVLRVYDSFVEIVEDQYERLNGWNWAPAAIDRIVAVEEIESESRPPFTGRVFQKYRKYQVIAINPKSGGFTDLRIPAISEEAAIAHLPNGTQIVHIRDITESMVIYQDWIDEALINAGFHINQRELILRALNDLGLLSINPKKSSDNPFGYIARVPVRRKS